MVKFLVLNPNPEELDDVLSKSNLQNSKNGPFEAVLLLGDVLKDLSSPPSSEINARTYFGKGMNSDNEQTGNIDVKENLTFLGENLSLLTLKSGFTLGFVSPLITPEEQSDIISAKVEQLAKIDILVTYKWPSILAKQNKLTLVGDSFIDEVVRLSHPRYHFAVGNEKGRFYESQPLGWKAGGSTRFISLGQKGTGDKWFYAFGIEDVTPAGTASTEMSSINPFEAPETPATSLPPIPGKRTLEESGAEVEQPPRKRIVPSSQCFFCLSNPRCETHMIVSIGSHNYLTIAKGPLPNKRNSALGFAGHAIIIPIEHIPSNRSIEGESNIFESPLYQEYLQFQDTLVKTFSEQDFSLVFYEINKLSNVHHHTQVIPVPNNYIQGFESSLQEKQINNNEKFLKNQKLNFEKIDPSKLKEIVNGKSDYILFTVCEGIHKTYFYAKLDSEKPVDLQFPRRVLASLLRCAKRVYWEKCRQTMAEEKEESEKFKAFYENNDFTRN